MKHGVSDDQTRYLEQSAGGQVARVATKTPRDVVLLRLRIGDMAKLDAASEAAGLTRAAFARDVAMALVNAFTAHAGAIAAARAESGEAFEVFAMRAFALASGGAAVVSTELNAAAEFDSLFGCG